jgi:hypothetical protein
MVGLEGSQCCLNKRALVPLSRNAWPSLAMSDITQQQAQAIPAFRRRLITRGSWAFAVISFLVAYPFVREGFQIADFSVWLLFFPIFLGAGYLWAACMWRFYVSPRLTIQVRPTTQSSDGSEGQRQ